MTKLYLVKDWGRTPLVYLRPKDGSGGWTSTPEMQDPVERAIATGGFDYPDGWSDLEAWLEQAVLLQWWRDHATWIDKGRVIRRQVTEVPDVTTLKKLGYLSPPKGYITRFYVSANKTKTLWFVADMDTGKLALGTKRDGYDTQQEAINVAEDLRDNRPTNKSQPPF